MMRYIYETNTSLEQCAHVVVKNRFNALQNPSAPFGADLTQDDVLSGPPLSWPLGRRETADHADGAIVMVLASEAKAYSLTDKPVWLVGVGWCNDSPSLEHREWSQAVYIKQAARMAYQQAGISSPIGVIDLAEIDDTYAYKELQALEALGFCSPGEAGILTEEGYTSANGILPVNISGGCLGQGNLLEANGLAKTLEIVLQLRGEAGKRQLEEVEVGLVQSWRGVPTTSGAVAILRN